MEIEGTWEEILRRSGELSGHRVRVTVLADESRQSLTEVARQWVDEAERLEPQQAPPKQGQGAELQRILAEKFRKQGLNI